MIQLGIYKNLDYIVEQYFISFTIDKWDDQDSFF